MVLTTMHKMQKKSKLNALSLLSKREVNEHSDQGPAAVMWVAGNASAVVQALFLPDKDN